MMSIMLLAAVDPYVGVICFLAFIAFCIKLYRVAYKKIVAQINRDNTTV
jgi:hypothetical protein